MIPRVVALGPIPGAAREGVHRPGEADGEEPLPGAFAQRPREGPGRLAVLEGSVLLCPETYHAQFRIHLELADRSDEDIRSGEARVLVQAGDLVGVAYREAGIPAGSDANVRPQLPQRDLTGSSLPAPPVIEDGIRACA